jgi:hypothetical protein
VAVCFASIFRYRDSGIKFAKFRFGPVGIEVVTADEAADKLD